MVMFLPLISINIIMLYLDFHASFLWRTIEVILQRIFKQHNRDNSNCVSQRERERERERDSIIIFGGQIWPMRPKILHFTWYVWKWVGNLDVQELYQLMLWSRVHIVIVREIRARTWLGRRCVESMVEYDGRTLYRSVILRLSQGSNGSNGRYQDGY